MDLNDNGAFSTEAFTGNIISGPDANGRGELSMVPIGQATRTFIYYMLSPKVLRFFESDNIDLMGGSAYAQAAASSTLSGSFVFEHSGWSSAGRTVTTGQLTANGTSTITGGTSDANTGGAAPTTATTTVPVSGTFAIASNSGTLTLADAAGSSAFHVYMVDAAVNILDPNKASGGGGALLLHTDPNVIGSGVMLPQNISGPARITGVQALNLENAIASSSQREVALTGVFFSDDVSKFTNGFSDYDADDAANPSSTVMLLVPFTGTYSADASFPGHFTCAFNIPAPSGGYPFIIPSTNTFSVSIYQASGAQALVIQTDTNANSSGRIIQQTLP